MTDAIMWLIDKWYADREEPYYSRAEEVIDILEALPATHRDVLEARFYERLSYRELAERFTRSRHPGSGGWVLEKAQRAFMQSWEDTHGKDLRGEPGPSAA
jgi:hypothetical protein